MRVFVAGATGTLGRPVVRILISKGHEVIGLSRSEAGARRVAELGAQGVAGNALNTAEMDSIVKAARPEQVVHLLTALPAAGVMRKGQLRPTNELRVTGTANLIRASAEAGVRRIVAESFFGVYGPSRFSRPVSEDDSLLPVKAGPFAEAVLAMRSLENQLRDARTHLRMETVVLRIGLLYGTGVPSMEAMMAQARAGRLFAPRASGIGPFVHIEDAATAIVAAIEQPNPSLVYNIADDEPISMETFLSLLASTLSAPPPHHLPGWVVRLAAPVIAELLNAKLPLATAKARRELGWKLRYPTVRDGLKELTRAMASTAAA